MSLSAGAGTPISHDEYLKQQQEKEKLKLDVFLKIMDLLSQVEQYERHNIIKAVLSFLGTH